jgi:hypothetical protein
MEEGTKVEESVTKIRLVSDELTVVGVDIKDKELVTLTLRALPSSFQPFKSFLKLTGKVAQLTVEELFWLSMQEELDMCEEESTFDRFFYGQGQGKENKAINKAEEICMSP